MCTKWQAPFQKKSVLDVALQDRLQPFAVQSHVGEPHALGMSGYGGEKVPKELIHGRKEVSQHPFHSIWERAVFQTLLTVLHWMALGSVSR